MAFARNTSTKNGIQFAEDGLRRAIAQEVRRMGEHIEKKLQATANQIAGRFLR
jgi:hypothetical protein